MKQKNYDSKSQVIVSVFSGSVKNVYKIYNNITNITMKKIIFLSLAVLGLASCGSNVVPEESTTAT